MIILDKIKMHRFYEIDSYIGFDHSKLFSVIEGVYLAGGSLRTLISNDVPDRINDLDLFFKDVVSAVLIEDFLEKLGYSVVFRCPAGELTTLKNEEGAKIQLVTKLYYKSLKELVSSFDICAGCIGWDGKQLVMSQDFIHDVRKKEISLQLVTYPVSTIKRIIKYSGYGYYVNPQTLANLVELINEMVLDVNNMTFYVD